MRDVHRHVSSWHETDMAACRHDLTSAIYINAGGSVSRVLVSCLSTKPSEKGEKVKTVCRAALGDLIGELLGDAARPTLGDVESNGATDQNTGLPSDR